MSVPFEIPEWLMPAAPPPPDTSSIDPHRVEGLVNRFIAAKQDALFTAPDAYYRQTGADAVSGAPGIFDRLNALRVATLDAADDEGTRLVLGSRLDAHLDEARDGINRHAAAQRDAFNRQTLAERQRLIQHAATLEHTNDDKLDGLAEANAGAAFELARMTGQPEGPAAEAARSSIWRTAIDQRLASDSVQALALFDRVRNQLAPADRRALDTLLQAVRHDQAAEQWIARQTVDGPPLQDRVASDPDLPVDARFIVRAKLHARDSTSESKRTAAVKGLDDQLADTTRLLATAPGTYKTGTLSRTADAYAAAGEPDKAEATRRLAVQESALVSFAQAGPDRQQRMIDELPPGDLRDTAIALQHQQADAFARDAFTAGAMLYPDIGPPAPIDDIQGRIRQAREIAGRRGIPVVPFTADEITGMRHALMEGTEQEKQAAQARVAALPEELQATVAPALAAPKQREAASDKPTDEALYSPDAQIAPIVVDEIDDIRRQPADEARTGPPNSGPTEASQEAIEIASALPPAISNEASSAPPSKVTDPNIVLVAGDDKEKRTQLPGSGSRPQFGREDEKFRPKQIDPLAPTGPAGGGFGLPRIQRPCPRTNRRRSRPKVLDRSQVRTSRRPPIRHNLHRRSRRTMSQARHEAMARYTENLAPSATPTPFA